MPVTVTLAPTPAHRTQRHLAQLSPPLLDIARLMSEMSDGMKITVLDRDGRRAAVIGDDVDDDESVELF